MSRYSAQQSSISENNRSRILQYLYHNGICSRAQIAKAIKLTPAAITKITAKLLAQGIIDETGETIMVVDLILGPAHHRTIRPGDKLLICTNIH